MKKIIFTHDFLFHSFENEPTYHKWIFDLFKPVIDKSVECTFLEFRDLLHNSLTFSRKNFFELSEISNPSFSYFNYRYEDISESSIDYLKKFIPAGAFIFGVEMSENLRKILERVNCKYINIAFHSFKLFEDIPFLFNTNDEAIYERLLKYKIPEEKFEFFANYWKVFFQENNLLDDSIAQNSALFVGQTLKDMSVQCSGKFLSILDYGDYLNDLCKNYNKVYYLPHPRLEKKNCFKRFLKQFKNISILSNTNVYALLANPNIKKVVGISSSVLYEAKFFNKDVEYLFQPLYEIDGNFGTNSYVSIYNDFFKPSFWREILEGYYETKQIVCDENFFKFSSNKVRNIKDLYWAYGDLNEGQNLKKYVRNKLRHKRFFAYKNTKKHFMLQFMGVNLRLKKHKLLK